MRNRVIAIAVLACGLGGCTDADWDHTLSYVGVGDSSSPQAPAQPTQATANTSSTAAPAAPVDSWCDGVAKAAAQTSREQGFDEATQRHQAEVVRNQCLRS